MKGKRNSHVGQFGTAYGEDRTTYFVEYHSVRGSL